MAKVNKFRQAKYRAVVAVAGHVTDRINMNEQADAGTTRIITAVNASKRKAASTWNAPAKSR